MVSPRAARSHYRLPHSLHLRISACNDSRTHSSPSRCLLGALILCTASALVCIGGVFLSRSVAPGNTRSDYSLPGGFGRASPPRFAWSLRDGDVLPGVSHERLATWRASVARSRLKTPAETAADPLKSATSGGELCGWPVRRPPARETAEGFQGDSVWYSANGSEWMQHAHLEILLRGMAENRRGQARGEGDVQEAVCLAVHLPPHWFPCSASPSGCQLAVWVRPLSSDVALLYHLLDTRSFRFLRASLLPLFHPSAILDAGANIGLASLVFAMRFPDALIVALEPARDNFELLQRNVKHLPQILPVNAALWSEDTQIAVTAGRREGFWAYETHVCGEMQQQQGGGKMLGQELEQQQQQQSSSNMNSLSPPSSAAVNHSPSPPPPCMPAVAVPSLLQRLQLPRFDYAKIDIEGAEGEVFSPDALARGGGSSGGVGRGGREGTGGGAAGWHEDVLVLSLEQHEDLAPGIGGRMEQVFPRMQFDVRTYGESTVYFSPKVWVHELKPLDLSVP